MGPANFPARHPAPRIVRFTPSSTLLRLFGHDRRALAASEDLSTVSIEAAEQAVDRARVAVTAL